VNPRQQFALTHPLSEACGDTSAYKAIRQHATGLLIMTILAVDR